jgi:hypothetical protein
LASGATAGLLAQLLRGLVDRRPDVVFLSSPELGHLVEHGEAAVESLDEKAIFGNARLRG